MKSSLLIALCVAVGALSTGCKHIGTQVNMKAAADNVQFRNITTGDGTFENYQATDHQSSCEIGIAVGIPFLWKIMELYPVQSNQEQLENMARRSKAMGANAMINVCAPKEFYTGFPFFILGIYMDHTEGTGIAAK